MIENYSQGRPGPWQVDSLGRKFRRDGIFIEYAPTVTTSNGTVYADEAEDFNRRMREQTKERISEERPDDPSGTCPLKEIRSAVKTKCNSDCVFYDGSGCIMAYKSKKASRDTRGKSCPAGHECRNTCALYDEGCTLVNVILDL